MQFQPLTVTSGRQAHRTRLHAGAVVVLTFQFFLGHLKRHGAHAFHHFLSSSFIVVLEAAPPRTLAKASMARRCLPHIKYGCIRAEDGGSFAGADMPYVGMDGFCFPVGANWRNIVISGFGGHLDPITGQWYGHSGMDLAVPTGIPVRAALPGTVRVAKYDSSYAKCTKKSAFDGQNAEY